MRAIGITNWTDVLNEETLEMLTSQIPCDIKPYFDDTVKMPNGLIVDKLYLIIEDEQVR